LPYFFLSPWQQNEVRSDRQRSLFLSLGRLSFLFLREEEEEGRPPFSLPFPNPHRPFFFQEGRSGFCPSFLISAADFSPPRKKEGKRAPPSFFLCRPPLFFSSWPFAPPFFRRLFFLFVLEIEKKTPLPPPPSFFNPPALPLSFLRRYYRKPSLPPFFLPRLFPLREREESIPFFVNPSPSFPVTIECMKLLLTCDISPFPSERFRQASNRLHSLPPYPLYPSEKRIGAYLFPSPRLPSPFPLKTTGCNILLPRKSSPFSYPDSVHAHQQFSPFG